MSSENLDNTTSKFKNYSINILIVIFAIASAYLAYNFIKHTSGNKQDSGKTETLDTSKNQITRQPSSSTLQVDVQNGTGIQGLGNKFMEYLRTNGYDVVDMGNFSSSDEKNSFVIDRAGNMRNAKRVATALGISDRYVIQQINKNYFLDATVVIGKDYNDLIPFKQTNNTK
jgi:calcineurin-like phosphoesterase